VFQKPPRAHPPISRAQGLTKTGLAFSFQEWLLIDRSPCWENLGFVDQEGIEITTPSPAGSDITAGSRQRWSGSDFWSHFVSPNFCVKAALVRLAVVRIRKTF
jgi:hypothetical protein